MQYVTVKNCIGVDLYICTGCYVCGMNSNWTYTYIAMFKRKDPSSNFVLLMSPDKVKNSEIEMEPNQAYETVSLPHPSRPAVQVHTKPCPAYEVVVQAHH